MGLVPWEAMSRRRRASSFFSSRAGLRSMEKTTLVPAVQAVDGVTAQGKNRWSGYAEFGKNDLTEMFPFLPAVDQHPRVDIAKVESGHLFGFVARCYQRYKRLADRDYRMPCGFGKVVTVSGRSGSRIRGPTHSKDNGVTGHFPALINHTGDTLMMGHYFIDRCGVNDPDPRLSYSIAKARDEPPAPYRLPGKYARPFRWPASVPAH